MKGRKREKKEVMRGEMPDAFALADGAFVARGAVCDGGVPLLVYRVSLPAFDGGRTEKTAARMRGFYAEIAEEIWRTCEGVLFPFVRRAYGESEDKQKRFRFARYLLTVDFTLAEEETARTVVRRAVLARRGKVLFEKEWRECFSKKSGRVSMPRLSRFAAHVNPKKGLRETLKNVLSRHTGKRGERTIHPFSDASDAATQVTIKAEGRPK